MKVSKHGAARWQGGIKDGKGQISTQSGALSLAPYGFNTRFEGKPGSNPEELIAAAHASCFSMALSKELGEAGVEDPVIETTAEVTLESQDDGFAITRSLLKLTLTAKGADRDTLETAANSAKENCPVSKLLNAEIDLEAKYET
jgi:osmotically inducible protein OsmC